MKELYISPVLNVLCFAPVERLASGSISFDDLLNAKENGSGMGGGATNAPEASNGGDDDLPLGI